MQLNVGGQGAGDAREGLVQARREVAHAGDRAKRDQSNDEGILNEILAFFALNQRLSNEVHLHHEIVHLRNSPFPGLGFQSETGCSAWLEASVVLLVLALGFIRSQ